MTVGKNYYGQGIWVMEVECELQLMETGNE